MTKLILDYLLSIFLLLIFFIPIIFISLILFFSIEKKLYIGLNELAKIIRYF
jgi:hypothetical protein